MGIKSYKSGNDIVRFNNAIVYFDIERTGVYDEDTNYVRVVSDNGSFLVRIQKSESLVNAIESRLPANEKMIECAGYVRLNDVPFNQLRIELIPSLVRAHMGDIV